MKANFVHEPLQHCSISKADQIKTQQVLTHSSADVNQSNIALNSYVML